LALFKVRNLYTHKIVKSGRNHSGKITVAHRASGVNREVNLVNNYRKFYGFEGLIIGFSIDSMQHRNCPLSIVYLKGTGVLLNLLSYNHATLWDKVRFVSDNRTKKFYQGSNYKLKQIPINSKIFNVEMKENYGGQIARSAGTYCRILKRFLLNTSQYIIQIELPSKIISYVSGECMATIGMADNIMSKHFKFSKAGTKRLLGFRPRVRGVAMNPVDHPHGGGEGKTSGGRSAVSAWGILTKGKKTVRKKISQQLKLNRILERING
jgi:large subunit ribosomal protein L2